MRVTKMHLDYWREKKAPTPTWASDMEAVKHPRKIIHSLINCQTGSRDHRDPTFLKERTLNILKNTRRREGLSGLMYKLYDMANEPGARGPMCRRYLTHLAHEHIDHVKLSKALIKKMDGCEISLIFARQLDEPVQYKEKLWYFENLDQTFGPKTLGPILVEALKTMSGYDLYTLDFQYGKR